MTDPTQPGAMHESSRAALAESLYGAQLAFDADKRLLNEPIIEVILTNLNDPEAAFIASLEPTPTPYTPENWLDVSARVARLIIDTLIAEAAVTAKAEEAWLTNLSPHRRAWLASLAVAAFFLGVPETAPDDYTPQNAWEGCPDVSSRQHSYRFATTHTHTVGGTHR